MTYLLTADFHLDDNPENEYRWAIFDRIREVLSDDAVSHVFVLGDAVDRKDRHSAAFVNRLLAELEGLPITILRGNHDTTLRPPCYWEFLASYVSEPTRHNTDLLLLPFTPTPTEDWRNLKLGNYRAVFMHATVSGARIERGIVLDNPGFPDLPRHVKFFSGDIHHPQQVRNVTYVGAPHPVKFGDDYATRMLLVDEDGFDVVREIRLDPPRKLMLDINSLGALAKVHAKPGDQVRLRLNLGPSAELGGIEAEIAAWAKTRGVTVAGTEIIVNTRLAGASVDTEQSPETILRQFAKREGLNDELLAVGLKLLKEVE